ncbi:hypothetical protein [Intestinibacter sp.]
MSLRQQKRIGVRSNSRQRKYKKKIINIKAKWKYINPFGFFS